MTGRLEERLRDAFEARVADPPALHAPADTALGRADVARRRRRIATVAAAAAVVVLVAGAAGTARLAGRAAPAPAAGPSASAARPGTGPARVDLVVDGKVRTTGGRTVALPAGVPTQVAYGWRVPTGWLLVDQPGNAQGRMSLVGRDGTAVASSPAGSLAVDGGGQRNAWTESTSQGDTVLVTPIGGGGPVGDLPLAGGAALGWWRGAVILSRPATGGDTVQLGLWTPGGAAPAWWSAPIDQPTVLGPSPDGRYVVAAVPNATADPTTGYTTNCLVELDPADRLAVRARTCPTGLTTVPSESPDHRWLVATTKVAGGDGGTAYELASLFDHGTGGAVTWPACPLTGDGAVVWETADSYLLVTGTVLNRCRVGSPAFAELNNDDPRLKGARTVVALSPAG